MPLNNHNKRHILNEQKLPLQLSQCNATLNLKLHFKNARKTFAWLGIDQRKTALPSCLSVRREGTYCLATGQDRGKKQWCSLSLFVHRRDLFIVEMLLASTETEYPLRAMRGLIHNRLRQNHSPISAEDGSRAALSIYSVIGAPEREKKHRFLISLCIVGNT